MELDQQSHRKSKKRISIRFLVVVIICAFVAYLSGPMVMTQVMLQQESVKAKQVTVPDTISPVPKTIGGVGFGEKVTTSDQQIDGLSSP